MTDQPDYLDARAVAEMLDVKRETVWRYSQDRLPPDARFGRTPVWRPATVTAYLTDRRARRGHAPDDCRACRYAVLFSHYEASGVDWRHNVPVDATVSGETVYLGSGMAVVRGPDGKWSVQADAAAESLFEGSAGERVAIADAPATAPASGQEGGSG